MDTLAMADEAERTGKKLNIVLSDEAVFVSDQSTWGCK
jgi:hypothetical protein